LLPLELLHWEAATCLPRRSIPTSSGQHAVRPRARPTRWERLASSGESSAVKTVAMTAA
jgi:hypothetical protein